MNCIGYAGYEAFDVILYIARTLTKLNYRILIIDLSSSNALQKTIKHGMGIDSKKEIINYRDINYTRKIPSQEELEEFKEGVVFVVYGYHYKECSQLECTTMNIVVNTFPHTIDDINRMLNNTEWNETCFDLLVRDVVLADDIDRVRNSILPLKFSKVSYLYYEIDDYESALQCQVKQVIRFTKITAGMERYITEQIHHIFPQMKISQIKKAIAAARKGV